MKKILLFAVSVSMFSMSFGQKWLQLPANSFQNWVNAHDVDVSGSQITIDALVTLFDTSYFACNVVSKHYNISINNYNLRPKAFQIRTSTGFMQLDNPVNFCPNQPYHIAVTYDGDTIKYYVNAVVVNTVHWTGTLLPNNINTAIGNIDNPFSNEQFKGYIDEVRIWNVARTQTEIDSNMYDLLNPAAQPGLLAYYKFEGNYLNLQGNAAFDGNPVGTVLQDTINPFFTGEVSKIFCNTITGISEFSNSSILHVFPNPNNGNFLIDISALTYSKAHLTITNLIGEKIKEVELVSDTTEIKLEEPAGVYCAVVTTGNVIYTTKIIIR